MGSLCLILATPIAGNRVSISIPSWSFPLLEVSVRGFSRVVCVGPEPDAQERGDLEEYDLGRISARLDVRSMPRGRSRISRTFRQLAVLWRSIGAAGVVCCQLPDENALWAALFCRLRRKPLVVHMVGDWEEAVRHSGPLTPLRRVKCALAERMAHFVLRNSRLVFTQGRALQEKFAWLNPAAFRSWMVHSTLRSEVFFDGRFCEFHSPVRLLSVGRLVRLKGLHTVVRALDLLSRRGIAAEWWCVGDGPSRREIEIEAESLGVRRSIRFLGYVPFGERLLGLYRESDIFVQPSETEGVPNAILEAMANSLPVVASSVGGIPSMVRHGVEGCLVPPGRPDRLAGAVRWLLGEPARVAEMRRAAFLRAQEFAVETMAERHWALVQETLSGLAAFDGGSTDPHVLSGSLCRGTSGGGQG